MFNRMKIGKRLGLTFGLILVLMLGVAATGYRGANSVSSTSLQILQGDAKVSQHSASARANTLGLRRFEKDFCLNIGSKEKQEEYLKKWNDQREQLESRLSDLGKYSALKEDQDAVQAMGQDLAAYVSGF